MKSKLPEGWKEVELGNIASFKNGKKASNIKEVNKDVYPLYGGNGQYGSVQEYNSENSLVIGRVGAYCGSVHKVKEKFWISDNAIETKPIFKEILSHDFLYYKLNSLNLNRLHQGTSQPLLNQSILKNINILLPELPEQKVIADTLSALDDKIENNNRVNENLEQQAQAIFKHWFVDFEFPNENGEPYKSSGGEMVESEIGLIPEEWEVNKIGEMVDNIKESVKPGEHLSNREYLPINNLSMKSVTVQDSESYKEAKSSLVLFEKFDILIGAMRVYFHRVNLSPFKGVTRTTTFVIRSKKADELSYNLFLLNLDETISYANKTSKGTTMPYAVWENGLAEMLVANPPLNIKRAFNEIILPSLELMLNNAQENKKLSKLRDTLLPKLMSGELRIPLDE